VQTVARATLPPQQKSIPWFSKTLAVRKSAATISPMVLYPVLILALLSPFSRQAWRSTLGDSRRGDFGVNSQCPVLNRASRNARSATALLCSMSWALKSRVMSFFRATVRRIRQASSLASSSAW